MQAQLRARLSVSCKSGRVYLRDEPVSQAVGRRVTEDWAKGQLARRIERVTDRRENLPLLLPHAVEESLQIRHVVAEAVELHHFELRKVSGNRDVGIGLLEALVDSGANSNSSRRRVREIRLFFHRVRYGAESVLIAR